jgi:DegV family protein with EDD domain
MSIRVVTDSTCDLPEQTARSLGIPIIPMLIRIGEEVLRDSVDISRREFYQRLPDYDPYPRSLVPEAGVFCREYDRLASQGASQIISLHLMQSLSTAFSTAQAAAARTTSVPVTVVDARSVSMGMGYQVELAARAAAQGHSMAEILDLLADQARHIHVVAILDMIEYLRRSGRMSDTLAGFASLLRFKPVLRIHDGQASAEALLSRQRVNDRLAQIISEIGPVRRVTLLHTNAEDRTDSLRDKIVGLLPPGDTPVIEITPVIGVHTGPGAVGFACITA